MNRFRVGMIFVAAALMSLAPAASGQNAPVPSRVNVGHSVAGELTASDTRRRSGKFEDSYLVAARRGQRIQVALSSNDFDPFLVVSGPDGFSLSNDDRPGGNTLDSLIVFEAPSDGTYRIAVTSFRPGETGAYRLDVAAPSAGASVTRPVPAQPIAIGQTVNGQLGQGDGRAGNGAFTDRYRFRAQRGQRVTISASSNRIDTTLVLDGPDGPLAANDDSRVDGQTSTNSRIDMVLAEDGEYVITVSSYRAGETGAYRLSLAPSPGHPRQIGVPGGTRVIAILVGVSDYGGRTNNLSNTDADARELHASLRAAGVLHPASVLLTNERATVRAVRDAFRRAAAAAGPQDTFMFFFSGHGNQVDVGVSAAELDGRAETIELYDAPMRDSEIAPLFAGVHARMSIVVIDACYAGGFRNLIDRPNVMGLFSSEEDLTSLVASRYQAGGFLSYFLRAGLGGEADEDGDRIITAGEISSYLRRRFRGEGDIPAETREDERNHQNLLIERGGVHVDDVFVRMSGSRLADGPGRPSVVQRAPPPVYDEPDEPEYGEKPPLDDDVPLDDKGNIR